MNQKQFCKRLMLWVGLAAALIALAIGLCFGRVVEETLFKEIAKWVVMSGLVIGIIEAFIYLAVGPLLWHFWYKRRHGDQKG